MKQCYFLLGLLSLILLSACYRDHSLGVQQPVVLGQATQPLDSLYTVDFGRELRLPAPQLRLSSPSSSSPLRYQWQLDYKDVSTDSILSFTPQHYGTLTARLRIYTDHTVYTQQFRIHVRARYAAGLYALTQAGEEAEIAYWPEGKETGYEAKTFSISNPDYPHAQGTARGLQLYRTGRGETQSWRMLFSFGSPSTLYRLDADKMQVVGKRISFASSTVSALAVGSTASAQEHFIAGGRYWKLLGQSSSLPLHEWDFSLQRSLRTRSYSLADKLAAWRAPFVGLLVYTDPQTGERKVRESKDENDGVALYDQSTGTLLLTTNTVVFRPVLLPPPDAQPERGARWRDRGTNPFAGAKLIDLVSSVDRRSLVLLLQDQQGGYQLCSLHPEDYYTKTILYREQGGKRIPEVVDALYPEQITLVPYQGGGQPSKVYSPDGKRAYIASGQKLWLYDLINASGTKADYLGSLASSERPQAQEQIVDVLQSADGRLFVATNDAQGGHIYCYDSSGLQPRLLWRSSQAIDPIVQLVYRD